MADHVPFGVTQIPKGVELTGKFLDAVFSEYSKPGVVGFADALRRLRENIALNRCGASVTAYPYAIADLNGTGSLLQQTESMRRSLAIGSGEITGGDRVETITLARALELCGPGRINLLKIDIEGGEIELVSGAEPKTWARVDRVVAEIHERKRPGAGRIFSAALAAAGFRQLETIWPPSNDGCQIMRASRL